MARFWQTLLARLWHEDEGLLTFEYILLNTVLVLGTVGAMSGVRDTLNGELTGLNDSMRSLDQMRPTNLATASTSQPGSTTTSQTGNTSASGTAQPNSAANLVPLVGLDPGATTASSTSSATSVTPTTTSNATATSSAAEL